MMCLIDVSLSIDLATLLLAGLFLITLFVIFLIKRFGKGKIEIDGIDFGLEGVCFHVCNDRTVRQVAYKIWVEINTRVIGVEIDLEKDIIRSINESYYAFFKATRLLIEDIPANNVKTTKELVGLATSFLNDVMRPYLTKWGIRFNDWYDSERAKNKMISPQALQKRFKEYDLLCDDLLAINHNVLRYSDTLKKIAFKERITKKE